MGGGDFTQLPDSMFEINQILPKSDGKYYYSKKANMAYPRHGHSCCALGENHIVVTGSRKDFQKAPFRTELYNISEDRWIDLQPIHNGRHYHSSCTFDQDRIYIFCGISTETKKYLNTIERLYINPQNIHLSQRNSWEVLNVSD